MKRIIMLSIICLLIVSGCSTAEGDAKKIENTKPSENNVEAIEVSDEKKTEEIQKIIESFYYNPLVNEETNHNFFEDNKKMLNFAGFYKEEYKEEESLPQIVYKLFGKNINSTEVEKEVRYSNYNYSEKGKYLPIVEGVYKNENFLIVKAGLYSIDEGTNSERKIVGMITATIEENTDSNSYILVDYNYEKTITE